MESLAQVLIDISTLQGILSEVNFKLYFNPEQSNQVNNFDQILVLAGSIVEVVNSLSTPPEPQPLKTRKL
jgi:hypothetical protein